MVISGQLSDKRTVVRDGRLEWSHQDSGRAARRPCRYKRDFRGQALPNCRWKSSILNEYECPERVDRHGELCILHIPSAGKQMDIFNAKITDMRVEGKCDFRGVFFPPGTTWVRSDVPLRKPIFAEASVNSPHLFREQIFEGETLFSHSIFGSHASFDEAEFRGAVTFDHVDFTGSLSFSEVVFREKATFEESHFRGTASFERTEFKSMGFFVRSTFHDSSSFENSKFGGGANSLSPGLFQEVKFLGPTTFDDAAFYHGVHFSRSEFLSGVTFRRAQSHYTFDFTGVRFEAEALFSDLFVNAEAKYWSAEIGGSFIVRDFSPTIDRRELFGSIDLHEEYWPPRIDLESLFLRPGAYVRLEDLDLGATTFSGTNVRRFDFHNVHWPRKAGSRLLIHSSEIAGQFDAQRKVLHFLSHKTAADEAYTRAPEEARLVVRDLKALFEDQRDYADAGDFYYAEMELRRRGASWFQKLLLWLYWLCCGYGEKPLRAISVFFCIWLFMGALLTRTQFTFDTSASWRDGNCLKTGCYPSFKEALGQSARALTLQQRSGFMQPFSPWAHRLQLTANALGPVQLALFALAMRRRFRR